MVGYYSHIHQQKHVIPNGKNIVCYKPNSTKMETPFGDTEFYDTRYYEFGKIKIFSDNNTPDLIFDYVEAGYDRCVLTKRTDK